MGNEILKAGEKFPPPGTTANFGSKTRAYRLPKSSWEYVNGATEKSVDKQKKVGAHFCVWEFQADATWKQTSDCDCKNPIAPAASSIPMPVGMQVMIEC